MPTKSAIILADNSGLGNMAWEAHRHLKFDKVLIIQRNNGRKVYPERFESASILVANQLTDEYLNWLDTDWILTIETPFSWDVFRQKSHKTMLIPMYECTPEPLIYLPDRVISVSLLDKRYYPNSTFLPWPINRDVLPWKLRERASVFVHNAGHGGLQGRNGTKELIEAMEHVKSDIKLIINSQIPIECSDPRVEVRVRDHENYWDIWSEGDVFIFPEKFNGLSLPIQEAISVGMPVMCCDRYPFNAYLPRELMIPVLKYEKITIAKEIESAVILPKQIAQTIDNWAHKDITAYSRAMNRLADQMSWSKLQKQYERLFD